MIFLEKRHREARLSQPGDHTPIFWVMQYLDLTDEEAAALIKEFAGESVANAAFGGVTERSGPRHRREGCDRLHSTVCNRLCFHGIDGDLANLSPCSP